MCWLNPPQHNFKLQHQNLLSQVPEPADPKPLKIQRQLGRSQNCQNYYVTDAKYTVIHAGDWGVQCFGLAHSNCQISMQQIELAV